MTARLLLLAAAVLFVFAAILGYERDELVLVCVAVGLFLVVAAKLVRP